MNIKIRFAILFTSFVLLILIASEIAIYFLYADFRTEEFYSRINREAIYTFNQYSNDKTPTPKNANDINSEVALVSFSSVIFDSAKHVLYKTIDSINVLPPVGYFKKAQKIGEVRFIANNKECLLLYFADTGNFVYADALDKYGLRKLNNIKLILLGVLIGGISLTIFISFFFVKQAFKPLKKLSDQMLQTTELSNAAFVHIDTRNDEVSLIAKSYNAMIERLKKAFDHQYSFVNHASHELRTPLAIMLSQTEAAISNNLSNEQLKEVLTSLKEDQQGIIELTNALLLLSQFDKSVNIQSWETIRIDELIYDCIIEAKKAFPEANINFNFTALPEEEDLSNKANKSLLITAIRNLIKNGYQYSTDKQVVINLFVDNKITSISVENKGKPIAEEQRGKLFIPFFRGDNVDKQKGHGLGLSIVHSIIKVHAGKIEYTTTAEGINCFTITLQKQKPVE